MIGTPVPVRDPGPDGEIGTADDIQLIVAHATGNAEFLVEGLREGTHIVHFEMSGMLEGLSTGPRRIVGKAQGAVAVRDPISVCEWRTRRSCGLVSNTPCT